MESKIQDEDLIVFSRFSSALWANPDDSVRFALETLAAASFQSVTPERILEKASTALLERAKVGGLASNSRANFGVLLQPFFRLSIEERLILVALHLGRWNYCKLGRILQMNSENLQEVAWRARLSLVGMKNYPVAPRSLSAHCPTYDPSRPWTQRYLDHEVISVRDHHFLQAHLLSCPSCHASFSRCKTAYYEVEQAVIRAVGDLDCLESFQEVVKRSFHLRDPVLASVQASFVESFLSSLKVFFERPDVRWPLLVLGFLAGWWGVIELWHRLLSPPI